MKEGRVRWGVISTARIGRNAVNPAIQASKNGELLAVASRDAESARVFAGKNGIPRSYGSYEDLLADPEIDAVYIPLPNGLHLEWTRRAAEAGKHVLCEKPLALNEAECGEIAEVAESQGVQVMEAFMYRFHPRVSRVVERIRNGDIGDLRVIRSSFTFPLTRPKDIRWSPDLGGGALMDVGCYCVNISRTLAGAEPVEVQATANWTDGGVDEVMVALMRFPNDVLAHFDCSLTMERNQACEVAGTKGQLILPLAFSPGEKDAPIRHLWGRNGEETEIVPAVNQYREMVEHFSEAVLKKEELRYPVTEAAQNMRTIDALHRSARENGRPVVLADD